MASNRKKAPAPTPDDALTFGSMPFDREQVLSSFTAPAEIVRRMASELALPTNDALLKYQAMAHKEACAYFIKVAVDISHHAREQFHRHEIELTESNAREIVVGHAADAEKTRDKELVLVAAAYVKSLEVLRALTRGRGSLSAADMHTAFELAQWIAASGIHRQIDVVRSTKAATQARQGDRARRVEKLADAIKAGSASRSVASVLKWRREETTKANSERARRDLREVAKVLGAERS